MKSMKTGELAAIAGVFLFFAAIGAYHLIRKENDVDFRESSVRYKVANFQKEKSAARSYKIAAEKVSSRIISIRTPKDSTHSLLGDSGNFETWAVAHLRSHIDENDIVPGDYAFLIDFRAYLMTRFPDDWKLKLNTLLEKNLQKIKSDINALYSTMDQYDTWLERNGNLLATMTQDQINAALWQKRRELFGEDAALIWDGASRTEQLQDLIVVFNDASHIPLEDQLTAFAVVWDGMRADGNPKTADALHESQSAFWRMDSIQMKLRQMNSSKRADSLNQIRRSMGYDEAEIEAMKNFDAYRDKKWINGQLYSAERDAITSDYRGDERAGKLRQLRRRYFRDEANRVAAEEEAGYFRFKQQQVYRN